MTVNELLGAIEKDPLERLRWLVLSRFNVLPGSKRAGALSDRDVLICGAHMVLDQRLRSADPGGFEAGENGSFEAERFSGLSEDGL